MEEVKTAFVEGMLLGAAIAGGIASIMAFVFGNRMIDRWKNLTDHLVSVIDFQTDRIAEMKAFIESGESDCYDCGECGKDDDECPYQ